MDTEGIRLFVRAAELLNISKAGRQLGLAPAVASARLSKLERQLDADLFHRTTRKVSLSLEGAEFLPFAREILAQEDAARTALGLGGAEVSGTLRFAASSTFSQLYIAPLLSEFIQRYPAVSLDLRLSDAQTNLIEGGFDLALRNYAIEETSLRARKLADDRRILCASPGYLQEHGIPASPEDLENHSLLVLGEGSIKTLRHRETSLEAPFPRPGVKPRIACDDGTSIRLATEAGVGISMNSLWSIHRELQGGTLVRVLPDYEIQDHSAIWLVYPKSNVLTAKVRVFIDFLIEKLGSPPPWED